VRKRLEGLERRKGGKARIVGIATVAVAVLAGAAGAAASVSSCAATPTNVPVESFQQARNIDYLCIAYNSPDGGLAYSPTQNVGLDPSLCTQVPLGIAGNTLDNHLMALVTQAARGEVAVVDVTQGDIVDESHDTPGTNFIPVGAAPTGIVVAPDAQMTFVSSADTNKPAIFGIPTNGRFVPLGDGGEDAGRTVAGILGDSTYQYPGLSPLQITDLPACGLPQPPQTIAVEPVAPQQGGPPAGYVLVAVLQGTANQPARVVTIDPTGLLRGVGLGPVPAGDGGAVEGGDAGAPGAPAVTPGILAECPILGVVTIGNPVGGSTPTAWTPGPPWADGVPYADAGDLSPQEPSVGPGCGAFDAGAPVVTTAPFAQPYPAHAVMRDDLPILYVGDAALPLIHVFDVSNPAQPVERAPLLATSLAQSTRLVAVGDLAISPVTRNYQRFLYAVDSAEGSVMVYDVTDPVASPHTPLERPHSELNPLSPRDRLTFSSPVANVGFAAHDWPILPPGPNGAAPLDQVHASTGLLCNPNPNANLDGGVSGTSDSGVLDNGYFYTATQVTSVYSAGTVQNIPLRLRGVFGFVTLTTGQVVTIDVDDWDAPCRRPDPMAIDPAHNYGMTGLLDLPESPPGPVGSATFLDPYSAPYPEPTTQTSSVTQEAFFPVSAPNRMRSSQLLRNDPTAGDNAPNVIAVPALTDVAGAPVIGGGTGGVAPLMLPTALAPGFVDPSLVTDPTDPPAVQTLQPDASIVPSTVTAPAIRLSFDDPTASQNQAWTVAYEGAVPTLNNLAADILAPGVAPDGGTDGGTAYETLTFTIGQQIPGPTGAVEAGFPASGAGPGFCERGVEDWDLGQQRAQQVLDAMKAAGLPQPPNLPAWTADYVEVLDDPLPQGDAYWNVKNACWAGLKNGNTDLSSPNPSAPGGDPQSVADARYNACNQTFGTGSPDTHLERDLPILRAYDDHLDVGRFYWPDSVPEQTTNRLIVGEDPGNRSALQFVSCCFHNQATFKVRAGGEWVAAGQNGVGFLHHVVASAATVNDVDPLTGTAGGRRCVLSCDPHDVLLSSRSFDIPWSPIPWGTSSGEADAGAVDVLEAGAEGGAGTITCALPQGAMPSILRTSPLALQNPFFSYVTWMGCALPGSRFDHTITPRDDTWRFQIGGGFLPLTISLTSNTVVDISPQSMRYIQPLGWLAVVDGQSQGLELIDLNAVAVVHTYH
jgi:hypothetical protein